MHRPRIHRRTLVTALLAAAALTMGGSAAAYAASPPPPPGEDGVGPGVGFLFCAEVPAGVEPADGQVMRRPFDRTLPAPAPGEDVIVRIGLDGPIAVEPGDDHVLPAPGRGRVERAAEPGTAHGTPSRCSTAVPIPGK
jgi:hypothetical protein